MDLEVVGSNPTIHPKKPRAVAKPVRHGTLTPAFVGSNPASPANYLPKSGDIK